MCMCMRVCICMLVFEYVCVPVTCLHVANQPVGSELFLLGLITILTKGEIMYQYSLSLDLNSNDNSHC